MRAGFQLTLIALACAGGCKTPLGTREIPFERIAAGQFGLSPQLGIDEPAKNAVFRSFVELQSASVDQDLWWAAKDEIDWSERMMIAIALGSRPTGGYAVEVTRVVEEGTHWVVYARETRPAPDSFQTAMLTAPFDCISTPRFDGKIEFRFE